MKKRFKIFLISNTSNFFNVFMINHIHQLSKNYDVFICCNDAHNLKKFIPNNVSLINISYKRGISFFHDMYTLFCTMLLFLKKRPHVSISFTPKIGFMVAISSLIARTPIRIHWFTGQIWATKKGWNKIFFKLVDKIIFFISHQVLIDSLSQKKFLITEKVISKNKSKVLHKGSVGGVNTQKFKFILKTRLNLRKQLSISKKTFVFLYLGRINKDKGIMDLVNAFKKIENNYNSLLIFVGPSEDNKLNYLLKKNKKILYFKFTTKPEDWFSMADILCLPSYREGFGTVVIEAASCGIPSLCSNIYGLRDSIIENKTGFFHKAGSTDDIKNKMLYIIKNKKLVKKYGISAKKKVLKDYEQSLITRKFMKFISIIIKQYAS